jgi:hypothetical protein
MKETSSRLTGFEKRIWRAASSRETDPPSGGYVEITGGPVFADCRATPATAMTRKRKRSQRLGRGRIKDLPYPKESRAWPYYTPVGPA